MRKGEIQILAEDQQQRAFVWSLLRKLGFNPVQFHAAAVASNQTLGRTFVLTRFPDELATHRQAFRKTASRRLIVMIDADDQSVEETSRLLDKTVLDRGGLAPKSRPACT
jgi:hypothetical protein